MNKIQESLKWENNEKRDIRTIRVKIQIATTMKTNLYVIFLIFQYNLLLTYSEIALSYTIFEVIFETALFLLLQAFSLKKNLLLSCDYDKHRTLFRYDKTCMWLADIAFASVWCIIHKETNFFNTKHLLFRNVFDSNGVTSYASALKYIQKN